MGVSDIESLRHHTSQKVQDLVSRALLRVLELAKAGTDQWIFWCLKGTTHPGLPATYATIGVKAEPFEAPVTEG